MKTAIVTDSAFYMNQNIIDECQIKQVPLTINFDDTSFKEDQFDAKQIEEIFARIDKTHEIPKTSQPTTEEWNSCFEDLISQGYERILVFTISIKISGTFYGAQTAGDMFMETHPNISVEVFDSGSEANGAGIVLCDILKEMQRRNGLTKEEIQEIIDWHKKALQVYLIVDDLKYLAYGGRIPSTIAKLGNALRIKPLIVLPEGELIEHSKHVSSKKAIKQIYDLLEHDTKGQTIPFYFSAANLFAQDAVESYGEVIKEASHTDLIIIPYASFGGSIGAHVGPQAIGYGWSIPFEYKDQAKSNYF